MSIRIVEESDSDISIPVIDSEDEDFSDVQIHLPEKHTIENGFYERIQSLNIVANENRNWSFKNKHYAHSKIKKISECLIYLEIGIASAILAYLLNVIRPVLYEIKKLHVVLEPPQLGSLPILIIINTLMVSIASYLTVYHEPLAQGSGIPEIKCYLNGLEIPKIFRIRTFIIKLVAGILVCNSGYLATEHDLYVLFGAQMASVLSQEKYCKYLTLNLRDYFHDEVCRNNFVLAGCATGVCAAFNCFFAGSFFVLEISSKFFSPILMMTIIAASSVTETILSLVSYKIVDISRGDFGTTYFESNGELIVFVLMSVCGGFIGAKWNRFHKYLYTAHNKPIQNNYLYVFETIVITLAILFCEYIIYNYILEDCATNMQYKALCRNKDITFEEWSLMPAKTELQAIMKAPIGQLKILPQISYFIFIYVFLPICYNSMTTTGMVFYTMVLGALYGRIFAEIGYFLFPELTGFKNVLVYSLMGIIIIMSSTLRFKLTSSILLFETFGVNVLFLCPMVIVLHITDYISHLIYKLRFFQVQTIDKPILPSRPPRQIRYLKAHEIMSSPVVCFHVKERIGYIYRVLLNCEHNGFPVVDKVYNKDRAFGRLIGIITRDELIKQIMNYRFNRRSLLYEQSFVNVVFQENARNRAFMTEARLSKNANSLIMLKACMNKAVNRVNTQCSMQKLFDDVIGLGTRHIIVVSKTNRVKGIITRKDFLKFLKNTDKFERFRT